MLTRNSIWYSILALTHHHANCPDDPLRPAAHRQQVGVSTGTTARGLFARPGDERLDADRTRCRREARFRTRPGRFGLSRIEPPGRARRPIHGHREARQVGREYIPMHRDATIAAVNPFGQKLARDDTAETGLGESQRRGEDGHARTGRPFQTGGNYAASADETSVLVIAGYQRSKVGRRSSFSTWVRT